MVVWFEHSVPKPNHLVVYSLQDPLKVQILIYCYDLSFNILNKSWFLKEKYFLPCLDIYFQAKVP